MFIRNTQTRKPSWPNSRENNFSKQFYSLKFQRSIKNVDNWIKASGKIKKDANFLAVHTCVCVCIQWCICTCTCTCMFMCQSLIVIKNLDVNNQLWEMFNWVLRKYKRSFYCTNKNVKTWVITVIIIITMIKKKIDWLDQSNKPTFFFNFSLETVSYS